MNPTNVVSGEDLAEKNKVPMFFGTAFREKKPFRNARGTQLPSFQEKFQCDDFLVVYMIYDAQIW